MRPWEPWPAQLAASLFLAKLRELLADEPSQRPPGDLTAIVEREQKLRHLAASLLPVARPRATQVLGGADWHQPP